jgi:hypothetical protein
MPLERTEDPMKIVRNIVLAALALTLILMIFQGYVPQDLEGCPWVPWMGLDGQLEKVVLKVGEIALREVVERIVPALHLTEIRTYRLGSVEMACWNSACLPTEAVVLIGPFSGLGEEPEPNVFIPTHDLVAPPTPRRAEVVALASELI